MVSLLKNDNFNLEKKSWQLRADLIDMVKTHGGHIGGSLSSLDLMIATYFSGCFRLPQPDHFILSAGHLCPSLYVVLADLGFFPAPKLKTYAQFHSRLQSHSSIDVPGVDYSSGALGQGLSFAAGLALADRRHFTLCLTTDGEHQEGQVWEAAMFAAKYQLGNLINMVDLNHYQIDGSTDSIMPLGDLAAKYLRFGWTVTTVDGHNFGSIIKAFKTANDSSYPTCIIANTILGRGVSFMQHDYHYHDVKSLDDFHYQLAQKEIAAQLQKYD